MVFPCFLVSKKVETLNNKTANSKIPSYKVCLYFVSVLPKTIWKRSSICVLKRSLGISKLKLQNKLTHPYLNLPTIPCPNSAANNFFLPLSKLKCVFYISGPIMYTSDSDPCEATASNNLLWQKYLEFLWRKSILLHCHKGWPHIQSEDQPHQQLMSLWRTHLCCKL